jgi:uncharacterized membrane protein YkoI
MRLVFAIVILGLPVFGAEKKVSLESLPPAVQAAVKEQTKNATLVGISTEKEKGKMMYEVETKVNGKGRDLLLDQTGAIVETEDEVDLNSIPAPARAAIEKRAADGAIRKVEKLTAGSTIRYEAAIRTKAGKNIEISVDAYGAPQKD